MFKDMNDRALWSKAIGPKCCNNAPGGHVFDGADVQSVFSRKHCALAPKGVAAN